MACESCGRGFVDECDCGSPVATVEVPGVLKGRGRPQLAEHEIKDRKKLGRSRAAHLYPLDYKLPCEWQGLKNCGGGEVPVIGCKDGKQRHRHHGPVKDPIHNERENVHLICHACHIHWHELNDLVYDEEKFAATVHLPEPATDEEIDINIAAWKTGLMGKQYTLASSVKGKKEVEPPTED